MKYKIYGYHDCSGIDHRFDMKEDLEIVNTDGIFLYRQLRDFKEGTIDVSRYVYFFSKDGQDWIYPLRKSNLKRVFRKDYSFVNSLDSLFHSDDELSSMDPESKEYNIEKVYLGNLGKN